MSRERSRSPVQPSLGSGSSNDDEYELKRQLLVLTLMTVVRAGIEVIDKTLECSKFTQLLHSYVYPGLWNSRLSER